MSAEVHIDTFDTTPRDGAQSLPAENQFREGSKYEIVDRIAAFGIDVIEAGFPASRDREGSLTDFEEFQETARMMKEPIEVKTWQNGEQTGVVHRVPAIAGLTGVNPEHIELTWEALAGAVNPRVHTFISTDAKHMAEKFPGKTPDQVLQMGVGGIRIAQKLSAEDPNSTIEASAEAASTTADSFLERVTKSFVAEGIDVFNAPDTVGEEYPFEMFKRYMKVISWVHSVNPNVVISGHNHNDGGNANANTLALVYAAVAYAREHDVKVHIQAETTICGLGERAGNADIFPFAAGLFKFFGKDIDVPVNWRLNPGFAVDTANEVMAYGNMEVHRQNPIVGRDTNVHRSGIHSDGVVKGGHRVYTPHDPTFWGHESDAVHEDGKYQGRRGRAAINSRSNKG
jgi:2-isopropylmalate synthase